MPKIDKQETDTELWQSVLIQMLKVTKKLKVQNVGNANVKKQQIHLLDIYFEWFLNEVQLLLRQGLIKQYYKETNNVKALKGKLEFSAHIRENLVHNERFYTSHQVYDKNHLIHQLLNQALEIVATMSKGNFLYNKCKIIQLDYPEVKIIQASQTTFDNLPKTRKAAPYQTALAIARLIILNYAPNVSNGNEKMLALLFDMNSLWEEYILVRLKNAASDLSSVQVIGQNSKGFWNGISIRPDIVVQKIVGKSTVNFVIDTKWKSIDGFLPSTHDLRQMYVYNDYWQSTRAMLLYPSNKTSFKDADFIAFEQFEKEDYNGLNVGQKSSLHHCGLGKISIFSAGTNELNENIGKEILKWFQFDQM